MRPLAYTEVMTNATLLWIDLEMTGADPAEDRILEVGAIATDWEFRELGRLTAVVQVDEALMRRRMVGPFWEKFSDVRDALMAQNASGQAVDDVEAQLLAFVAEHFPADQPVLLAGNSIHQDRRFIRCEWPLLEKKLHYRMLDVSAWKVVFEGKYRKKFAKPEAHRALDDIRGSIQELEYYLKKVKV